MQIKPTMRYYLSLLGCLLSKAGKQAGRRAQGRVWLICAGISPNPADEPSTATNNHSGEGTIAQLGMYVSKTIMKEVWRFLKNRKSLKYNCHVTQQSHFIYPKEFKSVYQGGNYFLIHCSISHNSQDMQSTQYMSG